MASVPQEVITPTVSAEHLTALQRTVRDFDREQLIWSSGFLAGLAGAASPQASIAPATPEVVPQAATWTIFYATETGNSRHLAEKLAEQSRAANIAVKVEDLRDVRPKSLTKIENALFVLATHGIGEPPEGSELFFEFWQSDKAPRLEKLNYSILALGDSSYADFCEMGRLFDARLQQLGATAVVERVECDLDFEGNASSWAENVIEHARERSAGAELPRSAYLKAVATDPLVSRDNPFEAEILTRQRITGRDSSKDVRHVELDLEASGLHYLPGDSLGVHPQNPPQLVDALLRQLSFEGNQEVTVNGRPTELRQALLADKEITILSRPVLDATASSHSQLQAILDNRDRFSNYLKTRQLIDLVVEFPGAWEPQTFVDSLRGLTPRLYSIASSPDANPDEAHLTVAVVNYDKFGRQHWGSASNFLTSDVTHAPIYIEANDHFRLPVDPDTPIIMVGAGTGVAPYRAFVEHRREHGHAGDNWLVYGDRNVASDFLYQLEWLRYRKEGLLGKLHVAFSRDQREKIYVQQRLLENGDAVFAWLERGAHLYVCGDQIMASDVHAVLKTIVQRHGGISEDRANDYVNELKRSRRYQRDVY